MKNKRVLVTGGGSGIGRAIAVEAASQGAETVIVADISSELLAETEALIAAAGAKSVALRIDMSDGEQVRQMIDAAVAAAGGLDTLVNNVGVIDTGFVPGEQANIVDLPEDVWDAVMNINVKSMWLATKYAAPHLRTSDRGPSIVNAASVSGMMGYKTPAYSVSKAAVIQLTRTTAISLANEVRCNSFSPGSFRTTMAQKHIDAAADPVEQERHMSGAHLIPRLGDPVEVARVACFLASDAASFMTGTNVPVDGGTMAWRGLRT
ncbi:SDR family NAD(P)-dependent oxidoreductase [Rhodococcoides yunnanense]|uniref:SDR family NAD(P)-dependent oxidoreductase n=1 Tax=Rhodococcoides yunnanense TaxID=278209 RepID=A0ABU4BEV1_9NOCA|nr:SDR family NAD(P)-dependent oxidoreductase [Rhodococcus yunnanensis]MDV6262745.1 SDR family NAD(P)-dependent oxidoreductase [Rhodococcus yunnanensis]